MVDIWVRPNLNSSPDCCLRVARQASPHRTCGNEAVWPGRRSRWGARRSTPSLGRWSGTGSWRTLAWNPCGPGSRTSYRCEGGQRTRDKGRGRQTKKWSMTCSSWNIRKSNQWNEIFIDNQNKDLLSYKKNWNTTLEIHINNLYIKFVGIRKTPPPPYPMSIRIDKEFNSGKMTKAGTKLS